jgi:hypothetical protein
MGGEWLLDVTYSYQVRVADMQVSLVLEPRDSADVTRCTCIGTESRGEIEAFVDYESISGSLTALRLA